ncbi:FliG C-terminal domain-containing protein [Marispirochaeta aestuarii]|uniref:FliG C-terminal domain-containing protein n=1 Tax=Marispirochaeta aestuarii TaxID=1963862 RepID=UPI0029C74590|nr:FliG C-terminal domain-containing protein [Marispirochaeta aestuarii]
MTRKSPFPERELARLLMTLPRIEIQNRLLKVRDRELALAMQNLEESERSRVYAAVSPEKIRRLREELSMLGRLRVHREDYLTALSRVISVLEGRPYTEVLRSYIRPRGRRPG